MKISPVLTWSVAALLAACSSTSEPAPVIEAPEWTSLDSLDSWRGFKKDEVPSGWVAEDGAITLMAAGAGDLITRETYDSFELELEWKISPRGNSGIMFHVSEEHDPTYMTGPEMQVLDNAVFDGNYDGKHAAGSNYDLQAPAQDDTRPVGEFNKVRMLVERGHVEHWLNGVKQCEYELWSDEWKAMVAASKFAAMPAYGLQREGHIALQDHGNPVWYRNIRIRPLPNEVETE